MAKRAQVLPPQSYCGMWMTSTTGLAILLLQPLPQSTMRWRRFTRRHDLEFGLPKPAGQPAGFLCDWAFKVLSSVSFPSRTWGSDGPLHTDSQRPTAAATRIDLRPASSPLHAHYGDSGTNQFFPQRLKRFTRLAQVCRTELIVRNSVRQVRRSVILSDGSSLRCRRLQRSEEKAPVASFCPFDSGPT